MSKKQKATDPARFEGNGISYRAKIIGTEDVTETRGDKMCQEVIQKLKGQVKTSGQHKQRVFMNVTLEGLKIIDGSDMSVLHTHPVHQISFISRDVTDSRAFGYIFGPGDGTHKFFGIKTANAAENLVLALRDLFQTVYEMKKQEIEDAKAKATSGTEGEGDGDNPNTALQQSPDGQSPEGQESIYQVPKNNAPVNPEVQEQAAANLLDLEDQVDNILKGIEQIKNLEFDELTSEEAPRQPLSSPTTSSPTSPTMPATPATNDPWGVPASPSPAAPSSSSLSDLQQLANPPPATANPFGGMAAFPGTPAPSVGITAPGFGMVQPGMPFGMPAQQPMTQPSMGLPVARDPFGDDPFQQQRPQVAPMPQMMAAPRPAAPFGHQPGFGATFPAPVAGQPFPPATMAGPGVQPGFGSAAPGFQPFGVGAPAMGMGMAPPGVVGRGPSPLPQQPVASQPDENLLQPVRSGSKEEPASSKPAQQPALFGDLVDIKKSTGAESSAKTPKEMFKDLAQTPKKSLNEIKGQTAAPKASDVFDQDPFTEDPFGSLDTMLNIAGSFESDPFTTTTTTPTTTTPTPAEPAPSAAPPALPPPSLPPPSLPPQPSPSLPPPSLPPQPSPSLPPPSLPPPSLPPPSLPPPSLPPQPSPSLPPKPPAPPDPVSLTDPEAVPAAASTSSSKESSPEARFDMPDEPPPPLPSHLKTSLSAPSPPPRPPPVPSRPLAKTHRSSSSSSNCKTSASSFPDFSSLHSSSNPPPLSTSSRSSSNLATSEDFAPDVSQPSSALSVVSDALRGAQNSSARSSPSVAPACAPPSPSPSWGSNSTLSHSSSQKSLERAAAMVSANSDDPFGVPLRSKKSFSSADGASKRSSRSSAKLSSKSNSKASLVVDPFGVPLADRTNSTEGVGGEREVSSVDNPFSLSARTQDSRWEAFPDHFSSATVSGAPAPGAVITSNGQKANASPFGDSFAAPVNGKPAEGQS